MYKDGIPDKFSLAETHESLTWGPFSYVLATVFFEAIHGFGCGPLTSPLTGPESKFFSPEEITATTPF
uniref:Uncharacterized protein n=1 Tax=Salix viminalis TaxID=40686 RepID=A0A6N2N1F3_SALVM